jgi:predicted O-linked N-acetylglucosamine transferase (SPINDLY family)
MGASLLNALDLPELIGTTQKEYEAIAVELGNNPERLGKLKQKLISNIPTTLLYNTSLFTNSLESAYQIMCDRHRNRESPNDIYINN